jgi:plastocyanin
MKSILLFVLYLVTNFALAATKHDIEIIKFKFTPAEISIQIGDMIRWTNKEKRQYHSVWFEQLGEPEPDYFFPDEFYERTFDQAGDFPYRCGPHPKMRGIVHVTNSGSNPSKNTDTSKKRPTVQTPDITTGRQNEILYILKHDCGSCHGMTLKGGLGPNLQPEALQKLTEEQVAFTITHGRPGTPMPPWEPFFNKHETLWLAQQLKQGIKLDIKPDNTNTKVESEIKHNQKVVTPKTTKKILLKEESNK